jgi:glucose dehydrogenase
MSGTVYESAFYVGISSISEVVVDEPCCNFQGSMVKVDIKMGKIKWRTKMIPDNGNKIGLYSGAAIWGSSPSIDCKRRMVYIATGNLYSSPPEVTECEAKQENKTVRDVPDPCISPDDHSESILALDLDSGKIAWAHQLGGYDTWVISCNIPDGPQPNCPPIVGPDYDFGEAPMMLTIPHGRKWLDVVIAGQKSGVVWALERDNGTLVWDTVSGPGSALGGSMWGMTTDGERVFTNVVNFYQENFTLVPSNVLTTAGGWVAMNASSGKVLWSVAVPDSSLPYGPLSSANGVVFAPGMGPPNGTMYALDPKSGAVLWRQKVPGYLQGGASISDGCIYFGEGLHPANVSVAIPSVVNAICLP